MAPKPKKNEPPPPPEEVVEDLGELPEFEFDFKPLVVRSLVALDLDQAQVDSWICGKEKLAVPLVLADILAELQAETASEIAMAIAEAKQKATVAAAEFR